MNICRNLLSVVFVTSAFPTWAGELLQPGVFSHEPSTIQIDHAVSGLVCTGANSQSSICEPTQRVVIKGESTCDWPPGQQNPCTHFGYEIDFSEAEAGTNIECTRKRYSPQMGERTDTYTKPITGTSGRISFETFRTWAAVDQEFLLSEVHDCTYLGEPLATIEYIIAYEPGVGGPKNGSETAHQFSEVPNACANPYLTRDTAVGLLNSQRVNVNPTAEHVPSLQSQCRYGARGDPGSVSYVFKFMLSDMFDLDKVLEQQVDFNATFANDGMTPNQIMDHPGKRAYAFLRGDRATLFVITGIKGSRDSVGRSREFVAQYHLDRPDLSEEARLDALLNQASLHMQHWTQN